MPEDSMSERDRQHFTDKQAETREREKRANQRLADKLAAAEEATRRQNQQAADKDAQARGEQERERQRFAEKGSKNPTHEVLKNLLIPDLFKKNEKIPNFNPGELIPHFGPKGHPQNPRPPFKP